MGTGLMEWLLLIVGAAIGVMLGLKRMQNAEWLTRQAEKYEWRAMNSYTRPAGGQARQARRYRQLAAKAERRERSQETKVTVTATDGFASVNCPACNAAVLLNIGAARERNEATLEVPCDRCHSTISVRWTEAA
jgi:hypothetical protein